MMKDFIIEDDILIEYRGNQENVIIPNGIMHIGDCAFKDCINLKSVIISDSVQSIGEEAFFRCKSLTDITIPDSVTHIGYSAFYSCLSLKNIILPDNVTSIDNCAFYNCKSLTDIIIPNSVTSIGLSIFEYCDSLKSLKYNYKAFKLDRDNNLYANRYTMQYKLGRTEKFDDKIEICKKGFHYCTNLFDVFNYYWGEYGKDFVITLCDVNENNIQTHEKDSKCCTDEITPIRVLTRAEIIDLMNGNDIL